MAGTGALALPFLGSPASAFSPVEALDLAWSAPLPANIIWMLLRSLPNLQRLSISAPAPANPVGQAITAAALASSPHLTSLTWGDCGVIRCLPHALAAQLTKLALHVGYGAARVGVPEFAGWLFAAGCPALRDLDVNWDAANANPVHLILYDDVHLLLDSLPPSVRTALLRPVHISTDEDGTHCRILKCEFDAAGTGVLASVVVQALNGGWLWPEELDRCSALACRAACCALGLPGSGARAVLGFWPLPSAGVVEVKCISLLGSDRAAAAAQRLAAEAMGGDGTGAPPALEATACYPSLGSTFVQVLQALWDGEEGGPGPEVRGVERLAWLVKAWETLRGLPEPVRLNVPLAAAPAGVA
ncbi:hypothetical protein HYH03_006911 [Edaphochlamys debaryana]|uniref:Uncharacterized protein n=1 Tax=Edaphochlamys debaryana TaxID=47281 RepID=A0A835Y597_9CHLO|nr:hypothetical protein HYH03_006911 [Edaphochlamys debaryana]|eukprot:KAG2494978.1 hypothetical protein HYH03_006911 [Edaphochlamys debaryana]